MRSHYRHNRYRVLVLTLLPAVVLCCTVSVSGQDFERYRPHIPPNTEGEFERPELPTEVGGDPTIVVGQLNALIFVDHPDKVVQGDLNNIRGIHVDSDGGLSLLGTDQFHSTMEPYMGGPVSMRVLNELVREVILHYRQNNQPVVDVSIPEQDVTDGVVHLVVSEARIGRVTIEGACYFNPHVLADQVRCLGPGSPLYESVLMDNLEWLNRNPFREVDLELTPGDEYGETDVIFHVHDWRPIRVYTGYEDTGTRFTGLDRVLFGINWGNAFWKDDAISYQYTASSDFETLEVHSAVYSKALCNRDEIQFFGTYGTVSTPGVFTTDGVAWQASARYYRHLCDRCCYSHYLVGGFDFKQTNTDLGFGGQTVFSSSADVAQAMVGYHGTGTDRWGAYALGADLFIGFDGFSSGNNAAAFQLLRAGATPDYVYSRAYGEREIVLPSCYRFVGRVLGQISDTNLLPTEQLGFGGYYSIRGYDMRLINGDSGYIVNLELHAPYFYPGLCCRDDELDIFVFYDNGVAYNHTLQPAEDPSVDLNSIGVGLRYQFCDSITVRADYGWQMNEAIVGDPINSRWHIGAIFAY